MVKASFSLLQIRQISFPVMINELLLVVNQQQTVRDSWEFLNRQTLRSIFERRVYFLRSHLLFLLFQFSLEHFDESLGSQLPSEHQDAHTQEVTFPLQYQGIHWSLPPLTSPFNVLSGVLQYNSRYNQARELGQLGYFDPLLSQNIFHFPWEVETTGPYCGHRIYPEYFETGFELTILQQFSRSQLKRKRRLSMGVKFKYRKILKRPHLWTKINNLMGKI